jgi:SAM-dependent methyltransferase
MPLNKVCEIEDWHDPELASLGPIHRKHWENGQLFRCLRRFGAIKPSALILSVGAGTDGAVFVLTNSVKQVYAIDLYGTSNFGEANALMLRDPDRIAPIPYRRGRLVVQYMNALDLRFEDGMFDAVFSLSSIEHFGGKDGAAKALCEMARVLKPAGIAMLATELIVNDAPEFSAPDLHLFTPDSLLETISRSPLRLVEPMNFSISTATLATRRQLKEVISEAERQVWTFPHIVLSHEGREFTSVSVCLRKPD